jgi:hypothetical protein
MRSKMSGLPWAAICTSISSTMRNVLVKQGLRAAVVHPDRHWIVKNE